MKSSKLKYVLFASLTAIGITAASVYSCEKEVFAPTGPTAAESSKMASELKLTIEEPQSLCGAITEKYLINKDGLRVGKAYIYNDAKNMFVTFMTIRGYYMGGANLHVTDNPNSFPLNENKIPALREFKYSISAEGVSNVRKFVIPVRDVDEHNYVAATAAVLLLKSGEEKNLNVSAELPANSDRIWIEGRPFGQDGSGQMFKYNLTKCETGDDNIVSDPKGVTEAGEEHFTNDPKMP